MIDWIKLSERQPEDDRDVLVVTRSKNGNRNIDKGYWDGKRMIHRGSSEVTHWAPIPKLPEE